MSRFQISDNTFFQNAHVLSLFNNVPETNLSTLTDHAQYDVDHTDSVQTEDTALGLKWDKGVARLPGSDIQVFL